MLHKSNITRKNLENSKNMKRNYCKISNYYSVNNIINLNINKNKGNNNEQIIKNIVCYYPIFISC